MGSLESGHFTDERGLVGRQSSCRIRANEERFEQSAQFWRPSRLRWHALVGQ